MLVLLVLFVLIWLQDLHLFDFFFFFLFKIRYDSMPLFNIMPKTVASLPIFMMSMEVVLVLSGKIDLSSNPPEGCNGFILRRETHFPYKEMASADSVRAHLVHLRSSRLLAVSKAITSHDEIKPFRAIVGDQIPSKHIWQHKSFDPW